MITIDTFEALLEELAEEIPKPFYEELNGGICVSESAKLHPKAKAKDLYVMGEYHNHPVLGKYIMIYYGSFKKVYPTLSEDILREKLRATLRHEFRHHMESRSGMRDLEIIDSMELEKYLNSK